MKRVFDIPGGTNEKFLYLMILLQCILTVLHHLYGEFFLYRDGLRLHAAIFAPFALLLTFAPLRLHRNIFGWRMFIFWTTAIWILALGVFEGFWNHILLGLVAAAGMTDVYGFAFIRSTPGNFIFELTGAAQFFLACVLAALVVHSCRRPINP